MRVNNIVMDGALNGVSCHIAYVLLDEESLHVVLSYCFAIGDINENTVSRLKSSISFN